jgi:hypothetical protein
VGAAVAVPAGVQNAVLPAGTTVTAAEQQNVQPTGAAPGGTAGAPGTPGILLLSNAFTMAPAINQTIPLEFAPTAIAVAKSGTDAAAFFTGAAIAFTGTVQLERSYDGGFTWLICNIGSTGTLAQYTNLESVSLTFGEPEKNVLYRVNCTAYTSESGIQLKYRISQTGGAAESLAVGPLSGG